ncbi:MAG TPA: secondary thiamine-phosphate synthase enzyme YjbQ [Terriglobia bacterium]|nr:secondary thiamine-phosphate synthase enzyme YjbQ [Terriglobia bacterium]
MASPEAGKTIPSHRTLPRLHTAHIETHARVDFKDITDLVQKVVSESGAQSGTCFLFVPHTTAAILITENDDPALQKDLDNFLKLLAPRDNSYHHNDGNCDAHLKAALIGNSKSLLVDSGRLILGRWQGVFLCDFDGPRRRELRIKVVPD